MDQEHNKDFDEWNTQKKKIQNKDKTIYCHSREIWWSILGLNIGVETDGKGNNFERPILIVRVYNKHSILVLPLTTKIKNDKYHYNLKINNQESCVILSQTKVISTKRLSRKIGSLDSDLFRKLVYKWKEFL